MEKPTRTLCVTRCGYVTVPAGTDEEAKAAILDMTEHDFDWEPFNKELIEATAEIVDASGKD